MISKMKCKIVSFQEVHEKVKHVAEKVKASQYEPTTIVGLARGGWIPARLMCDFLGITDLVSLKVEHWLETGKTKDEATIKYPLVTSMRGKKLLIVDDITDTGESMRVTVDYLKSLNPSEIRTAALQHLTCSKFKADYVGEVLPWRWVIFPWNFTEDMCTLIPKACKRLKVDLDGDVDITQIKNEMKQLYTIDVTEETVADILKEIKRRSLIQNKKK